MDTLYVDSIDQWNFSFMADDYRGLSADDDIHRCSYCGITSLDKVYVYIIDSLKEAGLLDESYGLICCYCAVLKEFGLLDLKGNLSRIDYYRPLDILAIRFIFGKITKDYVWFFIHDYSKINHWD